VGIIGIAVEMLAIDIAVELFAIGIAVELLANEERLSRM